MKKRVLGTMLILTASILCACQKEADGPVIVRETLEEQVELTQESVPTADTLDDNLSIEQVTVATAGEQILEQSFEVALDGWGDVTFATYMPSAEYANGDVQFKLLQNGAVVHDLPGLTDDYIREGMTFGQVVAVSFQDFDMDGRKDIITIIEYNNMVDGTLIPEARVYTQKNGANEFTTDAMLQEFLAKQQYTDSIATIMKAKSEYDEYVIAMGGTKSTYDQMRVIAQKRDYWKSDISEESWYALTDLDRNGRVELIISSSGGTGLYTISKFYEVNSNFSSLIVCETDFIEGDSQPDIIVDFADVYYDIDNDVFYYIFDDVLRVSSAESYQTVSALTLKAGSVMTLPLARSTSVADGDSRTTTYEDIEGNEQTQEAFENIASSFFMDMEYFEESFLWCEADELINLSEEELTQRLCDVWGMR